MCKAKAVYTHYEAKMYEKGSLPIGNPIRQALISTEGFPKNTTTNFHRLLRNKPLTFIIDTRVFTSDK